ncbi:hypothetical protein KJ742_01925, partial [Patescibacteria group bacterium]|nr:hypothetical protein [Patescibacteria group bacterium]
MSNNLDSPPQADFPENRIRFDKEVWRKRIDAVLGMHSPGLKMKEIAKLADMNRRRLSSLLHVPTCIWIRAQELRKLEEVMQGLEDGTLEYKKRGQGRNPEGIPFCRDSISQLVKYYTKHFSVTMDFVAMEAGMTPGRLRDLMRKSG